MRWLSAQRQIGRGVPQNRSRESAQSTLFASHSPMRPSRMCAGCQSIVAFWAIKALSTAMGESTSDFLVHAMLPQLAVLLGFAAFVGALVISVVSTPLSRWADRNVLRPSRFRDLW